MTGREKVKPPMENVWLRKDSTCFSISIRSTDRFLACRRNSGVILEGTATSRAKNTRYTISTAVSRLIFRRRASLSTSGVRTNASSAEMTSGPIRGRMK